MNIMVKLKKKNDWCLTFITKDEKTKEFISWDESGANEIGRSSNEKEAREVLFEYAKSL